MLDRNLPRFVIRDADAGDYFQPYGPLAPWVVRTDQAIQYRTRKHATDAIKRLNSSRRLQVVRLTDHVPDY